MNRISNFKTILIIALTIMSYSINAQKADLSKRDGFCKFKLGDQKSLYEKDLKGYPEPVDGVYSYRYTGILCQSYFGMEISYLQLGFKDDLLFSIKTSSYFTEGQALIFAEEAENEYGKPDSVQNEEGNKTIKRIWNGTKTLVILAISGTDIESLDAVIEVRYK